MLFHCEPLLFRWKTHCALKLHFGQIDRSEICTGMSFCMRQSNVFYISWRQRNKRLSLGAPRTGRISKLVCIAGSWFSRHNVTSPVCISAARSMFCLTSKLVHSVMFPIFSRFCYMLTEDSHCRWKVRSFSNRSIC